MKWPALSFSRRCDLVTRPYAVQVGCRTDVGRAYCRWIPSPHPALDRFLSRGLLAFSRIFSGRSLTWSSSVLIPGRRISYTNALVLQQMGGMPADTGGATTTRVPPCRTSTVGLSRPSRGPEAAAGACPTSQRIRPASRQKIYRQVRGLDAIGASAVLLFPRNGQLAMNTMASGGVSLG